MKPPFPAPATLLPHGPGMMLLDDILQLDEAGATCRVRIHPRSRFFEPGRGVPNWVGIEYMAQTIGVHAGHLRTQLGLPVEIGLLLGTRAYACDHAWFRDGEHVHVQVELLVRDGEGVGAYDCRLGDGRDVWSQAQIKAYQPEHIRDFLDRIYGGKT
ncbi:3-hydroxylacyl-ACP dehydratase [Fontimonas sp. SYSU GA230001]|uniref:ApeP family dehydratase n=1 Tax=Fontimonas sp. SYSU GA230001 TaxID=3142450 RepID=UPI0032B4D64D